MHAATFVQVEIKGTLYRLSAFLQIPHLLLVESYSVRILKRIIHLAAYPPIKRLIIHPSQARSAIHPIPLRSTYNASSHAHADIANTVECRIQQAHAYFIGRQHPRQRRAGGVDHVVCNAGCLGEDRAEADAGKHVPVFGLRVSIGLRRYTNGGKIGQLLHVIPLGRVVVAAFEWYVAEWRSGREQHAALGRCDGLLESAFGVCQGIGQGDDDRELVPLGHLL